MHISPNILLDTLCEQMYIHLAIKPRDMPIKVWFEVCTRTTIEHHIEGNRDVAVEHGLRLAAQWILANKHRESEAYNLALDVMSTACPEPVEGAELKC